MINSKLKSTFLCAKCPSSPSPKLFSTNTFCLLGTHDARDAGGGLPGDLFNFQQALFRGKTISETLELKNYSAYLNWCWLFKTCLFNVFHNFRVTFKNILKCTSRIGDGTFLTIFQVITHNIVIFLPLRKSSTNIIGLGHCTSQARHFPALGQVVSRNSTATD